MNLILESQEGTRRRKAVGDKLREERKAWRGFLEGKGQKTELGHPHQGGTSGRQHSKRGRRKVNSAELVVKKKKESGFSSGRDALRDAVSLQEKSGKEKSEKQAKQDCPGAFTRKADAPLSRVGETLIYRTRGEQEKRSLESGKSKRFFWKKNFSMVGGEISRGKKGKCFQGEGKVGRKQRNF